VDDARRRLETALSLATEDMGALAAATALQMEMRASEVTNRLLRDLDERTSAANGHSIASNHSVA
jgi:hypothetical protein